ncbi:hypothetical protein [Hymenobacter negativus]|uniref:DUF4293 family protein n=1 Tax=Hymenobacter negativus TaxID=2795026 RepID=A0ABS3QMX1_9BACT|nr:hypothetical protein [Hymenobacter negativus]MBO2012581.1 hypothetical protein [Hymenobacter negativus]
MKWKYFAFAIVFIGSMGVWLPACQQHDTNGGVDLHSLPANLGTYYLPIVFAGCFDIFLSKYKKMNRDNIGNLFVNVVIVLILSVGSFLVLNRFYNKNQDYLALMVGIAGMVASWFVWWSANEGNPNFERTGTAETGGEPGRALSTGK